jgi:hypothetical protein
MSNDTTLRTLTCNRNNWSGLDITVQYDPRTMTWEQCDCTWELVFVPWGCADTARALRSPGRYKLTSNEYEAPIATIEWHSDTSDTVREAVQYICNHV